MSRKLRGRTRAGLILAVAALGVAIVAPAIAGPKECEDNFVFANQLLENQPPDYTDAVQQYKLLLQQCPNFDKTDLVDQNLAYAYIKLNQIPSAINVLEEAVQKFPNSTHLTDLESALATAYMGVAEKQTPDQAKLTYGKAAQVLEKLVNRPGDAGQKSQAMFNLGNAQFNMGDFGAAAHTYQALMASNPEKGIAATALYNLGNAELNIASTNNDSTARSQAYDQAAVAFQNLLHGYPNDPNATDARLQLAKVLFQQKKYDQAAPLFEELTRPGINEKVRLEATDGLAYSYFEGKQYAKALPLLKSYVQASPGTLEADRNNVQIGYILRTQNNDMKGALQADEAAARSKDPKTAEAAEEGEIAVAVAEVKANQSSEALPVYQALVNSSYPKVKEDAIYGRAITMVNMKDAGAQQALADYIRTYPDAAGTSNAAYQLGVIQYAAKDYAAAAAMFAKSGATAMPPGTNPTPAEIKDASDLKRDALYWAGEAYHEANQPTQAVSYWKQSVQADPNYASDDTANALVALGEYYSAQPNEETQADTYFQQALQHFPNSPATTDALLTLGAQQVKNGHPDKAIEFLSQVAKSQPTSKSGGTAQYDIGVAYLKMTPPKPAPAIQAFQTYLQNNPNGPLADKASISEAEAFEALASSNTADKTTDLKNALTAYKRAAATSSDAQVAADAAWKAGVLEGKLNDTEQAIHDLDAAIAKYPTSKNLDKMYFEKGAIYLTSKQNGPALQAFDAYIKQFPNGRDSQAAHFNAAVIEYNTAAADLDSAGKETDQARAAALTAQAKAEYTRAASDFDAAVVGNAPTVPLDQALYFQGWSYANSGQPEKAITAFKTVVTKYPNSPNALTAGERLGILEASTNPDEAISYLRRYVASGPKDTDAIDANLALGEAYEMKGDCANAMPALQKVVDATHDEPAAAATYYMGKCYQRQGNTTQARLSFLKVKTFYSAAKSWGAKANAELQKLGAQATNTQ
ncbi:MAG TPA: tetratricopeptide repeat protein [Armatimonadota bacterium]|nr:tetratricopeptide repeat protein [Armatimonadota bacterium]